MLKDSLENLTKYNLWANTKILGFISEAGEIKADIIQQSSFPSIRKTLYHIWDAETIWFNRLHGKLFNFWPSKNYEGNLEGAGKLFLNASENFVVFVGAGNENDFDTQVTYTNSEGKEFSNTISQVVMHCMNHRTFHRGQIVTMLRNAGVTNLSSTDYIAFCRL